MQPEGWPDIKPIHEYYRKSVHCYTFKALFENHFAGIGTLIIHNDVAWLAHIIVSPEFRNRGIGGAITNKLVTEATCRNLKTIYLIATDLGSPVYEKVGFVTETEYSFFKDLTIHQDESGLKNIVPFESSFVSDVLKLDKLASGEDRSFVIKEHLSTASLYIDEGLKGYYLPRFGEGLIIATTPQAGLALMKQRLKISSNACFPSVNSAANDFLTRLGYTEFRRAKRMRYGLSRNWQPSLMFNRIGGNLG
jgi:GNAT superfamily N-acetyltransferase